MKEEVYIIHVVQMKFISFYVKTKIETKIYNVFLDYKMFTVVCFVVNTRSQVVY